MDRMLAATVEIDVPAGPDAEGARRATEVAGPASTSRVRPPDPEVPAKVQRRRFSAEYRLRILKQADACKKPGEVGALLRREGVVLVAAGPTGVGNASRARCRTCARVVEDRSRGRSTRASHSSRPRTVGCTGSCSGRRRSSRSKKKLPRSWGSP